jgi:hypothetical protein
MRNIGPSYWLDHPNNMLWAVSIMKFPITHSPPFHTSLVTLRTKYLHQHLYFEHRETTFSLIVRDQVLHPYNTTRLNYNYVYLNFCICRK